MRNTKSKLQKKFLHFYYNKNYTMTQTEYIQCFTWYCQINNLPYTDTWIDIANYIYTYPEKNIVCLTKYDYIFVFWGRLIRGEIDLTQWMSLGDIDDGRGAVGYRDAHQYTIDSLSDDIYTSMQSGDDDTLYICDTRIYIYRTGTLVCPYISCFLI
jgi:hypothetical protein